MTPLAWLLVAAPLFEVELRWVEQPAPPPGSLSSAGTPGGLSTRDAGVRPLGPALRVGAGGTASWSLELPATALLLQGPRQADGTRGQLINGGINGGAAPRWRFEASPSLSKGRLQLQLSWQQPLDGQAGGSQQWQSRLPLAEGRWTTVARSAPPTAPRDGTLGTVRLAPVQELQVRVSQVPDE